VDEPLTITTLLTCLYVSQQKETDREILAKSTPLSDTSRSELLTIRFVIELPKARR
jgi:hypothetical protein